ncbi:MAG: DUF2225 domain-containing protein [Lachnospiraceae bacterium]|jgi:hypothetical protein|nr:DUF2225 domain-containing protein [Lachnospiraceae bacterium]
MNLFSGLEKFGFSGNKELDITSDEKTAKKKEKKGTVEAKTLEEKDFLLDHKCTCPICDKTFNTKQIKTGKIKRKEPDEDLRPNFDGVDTVKYDATVCPYCGYAALNKEFEHLSPTQRRLIREEVTSKYKPGEVKNEETYSYDVAIDRLRLALICDMAKRAKLSDKAYICLKIAWLLRGQMKELPRETDEDKAVLKQKKAEYDAFYKQAYEGFIQAISTEIPPFCGMQTSTLEFMLANMAIYFKKYDVASKLVANLLGSPSTPSRVKDKSRDLKDKILGALKEQKTKAASEAQTVKK